MGKAVSSIPSFPLFFKNKKTYSSPQKLVAASDSYDDGTSFSGAALLKRGIAPTGVYITSLKTDILPLDASNGTFYDFICVCHLRILNEHTNTPGVDHLQTRSEPTTPPGEPENVPVLRANTIINKVKASVKARPTGVYRSMSSKAALAGQQPLLQNVKPGVNRSMSSKAALASQKPLPRNVKPGKIPPTFWVFDILNLKSNKGRKENVPRKHQIFTTVRTAETHPTLVRSVLSRRQIVSPHGRGEA